jgi:hypothetical protein
MTRRRRASPDEPPPEEPGPAAAGTSLDARAGEAPPVEQTTVPDAATAEDEPDRHVIDLVRDELTLARAQLDAGLAPLAEGTVRRRLAWLESEGAGVTDESDALRVLLAESLWRQGRPAAARQALDGTRASSPQRRLPLAMIVEAEALAAAGESDRAAGTVERVVAAVGVDESWELRAGVTGRAVWPVPAALVGEEPRAPRPPWSPGPTHSTEVTAEPPDDERIAAGRARLEEARVLYIAGDRGRGDAEMSIALRLDPGLAVDGVSILEPTLGGQPAPERLLLYGDLLRAAGREVEAAEAYDRAAGQRG